MTDREREELREERAFLSAVLDTVGALVVVLDREGRIVRFNRTCQEITGYSFEEVQGKLLWDVLLTPEEVEPFKSVFGQLRAGEFPNTFENLWVTKDGRRRLIAWSNTAILGADNSVRHIIGAGIDVTEGSQAKEALRESEATVRALLETAAQAILAVDRDGRIVLANATAEAMFGFSREELIGECIENLIPERLRTRHVEHRAGYFAQPRTRPMGAGLALVGRRRDGMEFPIDVSLSFVETKLGLLAVSFVTDITLRKQAEDAHRASEEALRRSQDELRRLTASLISAQEDERRRLARELHDGLNQKLAVLAIDLGKLERQPPAPDQLPQRFRSLQERIGSLSEDIRRMSHQLHPAILDYVGLPAALESECNTFSDRHGLAVNFTCQAVNSLPEDVSLCLYRVAQESLWNAVKHARADRVQVTLAGIDGGVLLAIEDSGIGFEPQATKGAAGLGLVSMEERVRPVKGTLSVTSRPGEGTCVEVYVPLPQSKA